jgi:hypothetical protein
MDDGDLDGKVRGMVGYSRYPGPPKVRVIWETLKTPKQPQQLNIIIIIFFIHSSIPQFIGLQAQITETINK